MHFVPKNINPPSVAQDRQVENFWDNLIQLELTTGKCIAEDWLKCESLKVHIKNHFKK
jgi:hypothetical protein